MGEANVGHVQHTCRTNIISYAIGTMCSSSSLSMQQRRFHPFPYSFWRSKQFSVSAPFLSARVVIYNVQSIITGPSSHLEHRKSNHADLWIACGALLLSVIWAVQPIIITEWVALEVNNIKIIVF